MRSETAANLSGSGRPEVGFKPGVERATVRHAEPHPKETAFVSRFFVVFEGGPSVEKGPVVHQEHVAGFLSEVAGVPGFFGNSFEQVHGFDLRRSQIRKVRIGVGAVDQYAQETAGEMAVLKRKDRLLTPGLLVSKINGVPLVGEGI